MWNVRLSGVRRLGERFAGAGFSSTDDEHERLRKAMLTLTIGLIVLLSPLWIVTYLVLGRPLSAAIPAAYVAIALVHLAHLFKTKRGSYLVAGQTGLFLALPIALHWSLGGFEHGSAVALWAFMAPLIALVVWGWPAAARVFVTFLVGILIDLRSRGAVPSAARPAAPCGRGKVRYSTLGFQPDARLDEAEMWPVAFALTSLTAATEKRIAELVRRAAG